MKYGIYRHEGYTCKWDDKRYQGSVCCNVTVKGAYEDTLDAIRFEMGRAYYDVRVDLIDKSGEVNGVPVRFSTDRFSIPINHLSGVLTILDYGELLKLPPLWGSVHPERPSEIKINSLFNDVEETSLEKIGWYKWTSERQFRAPDQTAIRDAFKVEVHDCQDNKLDWNFHARGWEKHADSGDLLTDYYADIIEMVEYNSERKVVIIRHREKPRIRVNINLKIKFEDILELKYSNYVSYEARFDSNENELLVDIQDAYGKFKLIVRSHNGTESLLTRTFLVPTLSSLNYTKKLYVSELEEWDECLVACLSTVGRSPKLRKCNKLFKYQTEVNPYESNSYQPRIRVNINLKIKFQDPGEFKYSNYVSLKARFDLPTSMDKQDAYGKLFIEVINCNRRESLFRREILLLKLTSLNYSREFYLSDTEDWDKCLILIGCLSAVGRSFELVKSTNLSHFLMRVLQRM
uniref:Uncharacterized protein n=1 Tax=Strigamia maritima TaxID=126957 RepID=T1J8N0_STRMM